MIKLEGVYTFLPTPFDKYGDFYSKSLRRVIDLFIEDGVSGFTALGVTMEHTNGRVPVIVGATSDGLDTCLDYCEDAKTAGAARVMVRPPRMPKLNPSYIRRHFRTIADHFDDAIVVQDFPQI